LETKCGKTQTRLSRDCQEIRRIPQTLKKEKERESILSIENNHDEGRGREQNEFGGSG